MKNVIRIAFAIILTTCFASCKRDKNDNEMNWIIDRFDDIRILRYEVPGFETLTLEEKELIYYLNEAALCGRDIIYDQNGRYNLAVRRTLEAIYENAEADKETVQWAAFVKYLKKVWFANGIHHHYSNDKFVPEFSREYFDSLLSVTPAGSFPDDFGSHRELVSLVKGIIFDKDKMPKRVNQTEGVDMLKTSAMNYYEGVTQAEAEQYYGAMADPADSTPVSYGLNSKLTKTAGGRLVEKKWRVGGMYTQAIERIVGWLEKAAQIANPTQKAIIEALISYYKTGDLKEFDRYSIMWVNDIESRVDFVNGFIEVYGDPLGYKASWESLVNFRNEKATKRTRIISENAQWFEDHSPVDSMYKKPEVKGVSAKVITAAILAGDCYPATPIGINLPNSDWIRKEYGSKSVTIENITDAYEAAARGDGFREEFVLRPEDRKRMDRYGSLADNLHTDLHECLGHGSGQLAPGTKGDELKNYGSVLEETRADLFALYYIADPKMVELDLIPSMDAAWAEYSRYVMNGMMTQLARVKLGKDVEQAHMRNRKLISEWCYEHGKADNVIEKRVADGKTYIVVNDFEKLRKLFGELLREVQRIKSEGDYEAGKALVETYGIKVDQKLHTEVLERYAGLNIEPYSGFVNPKYSPVMENGKIIDIKISYEADYTEQMLEYSHHYSFLPTKN